MYTEDTVLGFGKYKNKRVKDLPYEFIRNVFICAGDEYAELKQYIRENIHNWPALELVARKGGKEPVTFICEKRTYPTKKDAMVSIVKPSTKSNKPVPIRAYECPDCSGWHLTSKPDPRFKQNNPLQE